MTNSVKNRIMRVLAVIAIVCVGMVFAFAAQPAKATQNVAGADEFAMQADAGIYIGDSEGEAVEGIAFKTDVSETYFNSLAEGAKFYTIVTAEKFLKGADITALTVESAYDMEAVTIQPADYANFENGVWTYLVTITYDSESWTAEQFEEAYETKLVARSYVRLADGTVIYAQNDTEATSIRETASADLKDALDNEATLSDVNVAKFDMYVGREDVKAYFEEDCDVKFIDQNLNGADVYVVNELADGYDYIGTIQNGALFATDFVLTGVAGTQTEVVISASNGAFFAPVTEVTQIIDSKAEFIEFFGPAYEAQDIMAQATADAIVENTGANAGTYYINPEAEQFKQNYDGYYVLAVNVEFDADETMEFSGTGYSNGDVEAFVATGANPALNGYTFKNGTRSWTSGNRTLTGTFDGLGHYVDGMYNTRPYTYMFGDLYGTVQNLAITNRRFGAQNTTGLARNTTTTTVIKNVYIQVTEVATYKDFAGNRQAGINFSGSYCHLENVVVEYPDINVTYRNANDFYGMGYIDYAGYSSTTLQNSANSSKNVVAITKTLVAGSYSNTRLNLAANDTEVTAINGFDIPASTAYYQDNGVLRYNDMASATAVNAFAGFTADCWKVTENGITFKSIPNKLTGVYNVSVADGDVPVALVEEFGDSIVSIKDVEYNELLVGGKLALTEAPTTAPIAKSVFVYTADGNSYKATFNVYTDIITTKEEFVAGAWRTGTGAYILATDVDMEGAALSNSTTSAVHNGYFDGNGHVIDNMKAARYGVFANLGATSTIKNVAFTNAVVGTASTYPILAYKGGNGSVVSDVYIQVTSIPAYRAGAVMFGMDGGTKFNNMVVEFPEYSATSTKEIPVGAAAKDVMNWVGVKGYSNETSGDQGGSIWTSNYSSYYNLVEADHYWKNTYNYTPKFSNVITVSKTKAVDIRFGQGHLLLAENEYSDYVNADGTWKTDAEGTSYGEYFTMKNGAAIVASANAGIKFAHGITRYDDYAALINADVDLSAFDASGMWDTSTGAPVWAGIAIPSVEITVDGKADATEVRIVEGTETATFDISSELVNVAFTADIADKTIATYADGVITKVANGGATVLNYSYTVAGKTFTGSLPVVIEKAYAKLGTIIIDNDTTELTGLAVDGNIVSVKGLDGTEYFVDGDITLTNNADDVLSVVVIITTDTGAEYKATIDVYTAIIDDFAELNRIFGYQQVVMTVTQSVVKGEYKWNASTKKAELWDNGAVVTTPEVVWSKTLSTTNADDVATYLNTGAGHTFKFAYQAEGYDAGVVPAGYSRAVDVHSLTCASLGGSYILGADLDLSADDLKLWDPYNHKDYSPNTYNNVFVTSGSTIGTARWTEDADGNEISYSGAGHNVYLGENRRFTGTFDGNGHTINGMIFNGSDRGGFFGLTDGAVIKNVGFTNVTLSVASTSVIATNNLNAETVIENVYVEVTSWTAGAGRHGAIYQAANATTKTVNMKNVVVVAPTETATSGYTNGALWSHPGNVAQTAEAENVIVISGTKWLGNYNNSRVTVAENSTYTGTSTTTKINGIFHYDDIDGAITAGKTVVGNWVISETGIAWADSVDAGSAEQSKN